MGCLDFGKQPDCFLRFVAVSLAAGKTTCFLESFSKQAQRGLMFRFFESRVQPYPQEEPTVPPSTLVAFCWHYSRPVASWLIFMSVLTAAMAAGEVLLFGFLGSIVDWLVECRAGRLSGARRNSSLADGRISAGRACR